MKRKLRRPDEATTIEVANLIVDLATSYLLLKRIVLRYRSVRQSRP